MASGARADGEVQSGSVAPRLFGLRGQSMGVEPFSFLPQSQSEAGDLACQVETGLVPSAPLIEALLVKRMQETGRPGGRQGGALKDLLQLAVVLGVQTPDARGSLAADDLAADDLVLPGVARDQTQAGIRPQLPFGAKAKRGAQESQQESGPHRPDARHGAEE